MRLIQVRINEVKTSSFFFFLRENCFNLLLLFYSLTFEALTLVKKSGMRTC